MFGARPDAWKAVFGRAPRSLSVLAAVLLSGCGGGASLNPFGGGGVGDVETVFLAAAGNWDRNKDGIVTCDEWKAYATELFDGADTNKDGFLTPDEFPNVVKVDRMFETADFSWWDVNKDGKISRAEFVDRPNPAFVLLDKEKKCQLTSTELAAGRHALAQKKPMIGPPPDLDSKKGGGVGKP